VLRRETNPALRAQMVEPDFTDSEIAFNGGMAMRAGTAFSLGEETKGRSVRVGKQFVEIGGLPVLIEAVEFQQLEPLLAGLASAERSETRGLAIHSSRQVKRAKEQARLPREHYWAFDKAKEIQLASNPLSQPAVVVDYELLGSGTNVVLKGGTTWLVSGLVNVTNLVIEGTAVVKVTNSPSAKIVVNGTVDCQTGPYRPAIFTSQYDTSVGESIGSGTLTNYPGALVINSSGKVLRDLRISHATNGVALGFSGGQISLTNVQFVHCRYAIDFNGNSEDTVRIGNGLFYGVTNVLNSGYDNFLRGEHLTVNQCQKLFKIGNGNHNGEVYLTNSILANLAALGDADVFDGSHNGFYNCTPFGFSPFTNSTYPFQTVGAGAHYLATTSFLRNTGTVGITVGLRFELQKKTTYPPVEITTNITGNTILLPQAERDTSQWDLGFHYDPLDWLCSQISPGIGTVTITLTNGVAVGLYGSYGFSLRENNRFVSEGRPEALNRIVWYPSVQEQPVKLNNVSIGSSGMFDVTAASSTYTAYTKPILQLRFTELVGLGRRQTFFYPVAYYYGLNTVALTDCWLRSMDFSVSGYNWTVTGFPVPVATLQNNLVERGTVSLFNGYFNNAYQCPLAASLYNNLFWSSSLALTYNDYYATAHPNWYVKDNLFDTATNSFTGTGSYTTYVNRSHNGFNATTNNLGGSTNLTLMSLAYGSGPLGSFYPAANPLLDNVGSRDAYTAGLFHHTIKINQGMAVMETNSIVDIGFHYMAVGNGVPFDTDGDLIPDYADPDSDSNDGLPDWWEQKYMGGLAETPSGDFDGDCLTNLFEYQQASNPADKPAVTSAPVYQIVPIGANVTFSVAGSPGCVKYQWYKDFAAIVGATNTSLTLTSVQLTSNALYKANVFSGAGVTSAAARLVVLDSPAWTIYTNHLAHTNNKTINLWATNYHPIKTNTPILAWDTNSLLYGKTGFTAISQANSFQGKYAPVTALTKRHGFTAGHALTTESTFGFAGHEGTKVWFCGSDNKLVTMTNAIAYVRTTNYDYALFIFTTDLPDTVTPMAVTNPPSSIGVCFRKNQDGKMSANLRPPFESSDSSKPPFNDYSTTEGGDSGSANMIPTTDGSLVFIGGISTSGALSDQMQQDMNILTLYLNLNTNDYGLNWHTNYP
jgi:hypothetical protein